MPSEGQIFCDRGKSDKVVDYNVSDKTPWATYVANQPNYNNIGRYNYYNNDNLGYIEGYSVWTDNTSCLGTNWPVDALNVIKNAGIESAFGLYTRTIIPRTRNITLNKAAQASSCYGTGYEPVMGNDGNIGTWAGL